MVNLVANLCLRKLSKILVLKRLLNCAILLLVIVSFAGCQPKAPESVKLVIRKAGKNRNELNKVIGHYKETGERQKLKAAYFLIGNMEEKYGIYYPEDIFFFDILVKIDSMKHTNACESLIDELVDNEYRKYRSTDQNKQLKAVRDIDIITAGYLIENIDLAFDVWKTKPWASHLRFKEFCEWILPYRVKTEPLQYWRKYMYNKLSLFEDSLKNPDDPKELCLLINEHIARDFQFTHTLGFMPVLGGVDLWNTKAGTCDQRYPLITMAMRCMGVPAGIDFTFQYPHFPGNHEWTVILDRGKKTRPYNGGEKKAHFFIPAACPIGNTFVYKVSTVFRYQFAKNPESIVYKTDAIKIPENFRNAYISDVTGEYDGMNKQDLTLEFSGESDEDFVFLYVFSTRNDVVPVSYARVKNTKVTFKNTGKAGVYFLGYSDKDRIIMDGDPFILPSGSDKIQPISPQDESTESVTLYRKFPVKYTMDVFIDQAAGSKIQGANNRDFSDSVTLYKLDERITYYEEIPLDLSESYRYYRYKSDTSDIRIADIIFSYIGLQNSKLKLNGSVYGHQAGDDNCYETVFENAFDDNISTNFNAVKGSWVAMDAGRPVKLASFSLLIRNNQNIVEKGDTYELLYFDKIWNSLGTKVADDYHITFDRVPKGALLMLRDLTKGKEERVFFYRNGKQDWWVDL